MVTIRTNPNARVERDKAPERMHATQPWPTEEQQKEAIEMLIAVGSDMGVDETKARGG